MTDYSGYTDDELQAKLVEVLEKMASIRTQVDHAKSESAQGIYADPVWFNAARHALRKTGVEHQALLMEQSARKKARYAIHQQNYSERFIAATRSVVTQEQWEQIQAITGLY